MLQQAYTNKEEVLLRAYEGLASRGVPWVDFYNTFSTRWEIYPIEHRGVIIGGIFFKGQEGHLSVAPQFQRRWNPKKYLKELVIPLLEERKELYTTVLKTAPDAITWTRKLGFEQYKEDSERVYFKMTKANYV